MTDYVIGSPSFFNEDSKFFRDVYIYGKLHYDFKQNDPIEFNNVIIRGTLDVYGKSNFYDDVYLHKNLSVGILTVRTRLDVGIGGTVIKASTDTGKVGIGSTVPIQKLDVVGNALFTGNIGIGATTIPEQRLDIGGSVKIDKNIYDSVNVPGKNGYELVRDERGIRWIPLISDPLPGVPGIPEEGIFILNEFTPLDAPGNRETYSTYATYATNAGIATYATSSGVSTSVIGGIASVTQLYVSSGIITAAGQFQSTQANSTTTGGGQIYLNGATGNRIDFNTNGVAAPATTTRSVGTKIVLFPNISATQVDYALGIDNSTFWYSATDSNSSFKWYAGITNIATLSGAGALSVTGTVSGTNITTGGNVTGSSASVENAATFNNGGAGAASGTTFNGSAVQTISYNTVGASPLAGSSSLVTTGTVTSGTWSGSFGAVSGANLTSLTAGNLSGTIPSAVLGNSTVYVGTTAILLNRASGAQSLTGITSIDGSSASCTGNAATATTFSTGRTNYSGVTNNAVSGQMMWKNYGNNHTIFDASASTSPDGGAVNNTNSQVAWSSTYPTLMGWNGANTYGVRVDSARIADTVTTNANLTGDVTSTGNATSIAAGVIVDADINASAAIVDTKLATISTAGKVSNSATTATNVNTASAIVARDASGNFSSGSIAISGNGSTLYGPNSTWAEYLRVGGNGNADTTNASVVTTNGNLHLDAKTGAFATYINYYKGTGGIKFGNGAGDIVGSIDSSGNLGIGTASPAEKLHIHSDLAVIRLSGSAASQTPFNIRQGIVGTSNAGFSIYDVNNSATRFAIDPSGNIGIGTNSPSSVLDVATSNSGITLTNTGASNKKWRLGGSSAGSFVITETGVADRLTINTSGNLGVGVASPLQTLDVRGNFLLASDPTTSYHITQKHYTTNNGTLSWEGSAGQLFSITNNLTSGSIFSVNDVSGIPSIDVNANGTVLVAPYGGNLGIGTALPTTRISIAGTTGISFADTNIRIGDVYTGSSITTGTHNFFGGVSAGRLNTSGIANNFFGCNAGCSNTTGRHNNFFGLAAGCSNTTASGNNFFGGYAGGCNTTGYQNNFLGYYAGRSNTTGGNNNFLGSQAGRNNISGGCNNFFSLEAGCCNTTGSSNNFFGYRAGRFNTSGCSNNFLGAQAGYCNTTGGYNNFFGNYAGRYNTSGYFNNFFGYNAGRSNTTGSGNNFFGCNVAYTGPNTGCHNNFFGETTGFYNTTGSFNNFFVYSAGFCNTTGTDNNFFGRNAGRSNTSGSCNNFFGLCAGWNNTSASNNIAIGWNAGTTGLTPSGLINFTTTENQIVMGNAGHTVACIQIAWTTASDIRYKCVWGNVSHGRDFLRNVTPIKYSFVDHETKEVKDPNKRYGFSAQEILALEGEEPIIVSDKNPDNLGMNYEYMIPILVNAIKELDVENQELKMRLKTLEDKVGITTQLI